MPTFRDEGVSSSPCTTLMHMCAFVEAWTEVQIVQEAAGQLP
jgi:hypothetical protein